MHKKTLYIIFSSLIGFLLMSCQKQQEKQEVIASVYKHQLLKSEIVDLYGEKIFTDDESLERIVDEWVKKKLIFDSAVKKVSNKTEIDELVDNYRQSLIIQKHKENYLAKNLNMNISDEEMNLEYEAIKNDYRLNNSIFKMELLLSPADHFDKLDLKNFFKKKEFDEWRSSLANLVDLHIQDTINWYSWKKLQQYVPVDLLTEDEIEENKSYDMENEKHLFFLRIFDLVDKNEIPPLSYMKPKLERVILERRRETLLKNYSSELYSKALKNNMININ